MKNKKAADILEVIIHWMVWGGLALSIFVVIIIPGLRYAMHCN